MENAVTSVSVVITSKNEGKNIEALLNTLSVQDGLFEVILVDSMSTDETESIVASFSGKLDLHYLRVHCSRGEGRNIGVNASTYPSIIFTDADTEWEKSTLNNYRKFFTQGFSLIAGRVTPKGNIKFFMDRVKLFFRNFEVTSPSANLGISRELFLKLHGFDSNFVTAEDIDLNIRAILEGGKFTYCNDCIVYNKVRDSLNGFLRQAFWNGYGRYQLRKKHSAIWNEIKKERGTHYYGFYNALRLAFAAIGYIYSILRRGKFPAS